MSGGIFKILFLCKFLKLSIFQQRTPIHLRVLELGIDFRSTTRRFNHQQRHVEYGRFRFYSVFEGTLIKS